VPQEENASVTQSSWEIDATTIHSILDPLLRIPSTGGTPAETDAQLYIAELLTEIGMEVHTWDIDLEQITTQTDFPGMEVPRAAGTGVLGVWRGSGELPAVMINGHTDVVPPGDLDAWHGDPFTPRYGNVHGQPSVIARGACDMKGGLIAALQALVTLKNQGFVPRGDILVAPVIGEEDGGLGTYSLLLEGLPLLYSGAIGSCVIPEPTSLAVIPANAGALTFRLRVPGAAIHASRRSEGISAIEKFYPLFTALQDLERQRNANTDPLMSRWPIAYPLSIGTVTAGDWASTVPDLLVAEGRYGVALGEDVGSARSALEECIHDACQRDPWLSEHPATIEWWGGQFESGSTDPESDVIQQLSQAHADVIGSSPELFAAPYGSDLRLLTRIGGIPTVQYGPGDAGVAHAPNEYVTDHELVRTHQVCAQYLSATLG
jgi:acetylornithine deacetylase